MKQILIGRLIKDYRKEQKINQEALCRGICERSVLSRIENGQIMPDSLQAYTLFSRLGKDVPKNLIPITQSDRRKYNIISEIRRLHFIGDKRRLELLNEYKKYSRKWTNLDEQFYLLQKGLFISQYDEKLEEALKLFEKALLLTFPEYSDSVNISLYRFSECELQILLQIAFAYYYIYDLDKKKNNLKKKAFYLINFLKSYYKKFVSNYENKNLYSVILFQYTNWLGLNKHYEQAYKLSVNGIDISIKCNSLNYFSYHYFNKAYTEASLQDFKNAEKDFIFSLGLLKNMDDANDIPMFVETIKREFNLEIKL